jgi:hypothetical protein
MNAPLGPTTPSRTPRTAPTAPRAAWEMDPVLAGEDAQAAADFDALTDLFLGEVGPKAQAPAPGATPDATPGATPDAGSRPVLRLAGEAELEEEPAAVRPPPLPPPLPMSDEREPEAPSPSPAIVECIVLGHLPVMASAWASQYVREIALAAGKPVAFLRVQAGYVTLELVGELPGGSAGRIVPSTTIEHALTTAATITDRWIVRTDMGEEVGLASHELVRMVTILTGADEAARVGAYSVIKSLAAALPGETPGDDSGPMIRLAVMSAPEPRAEQAAARLADAVQTFLGRTVQHAMWSPRIRSSRSPVLLYSGPSELTPLGAMNALAKLGQGVPTPPAAPARAARATSPTDPADDALAQAFLGLEPAAGAPVPTPTAPTARATEEFRPMPTPSQPPSPARPAMSPRPTPTRTPTPRPLPAPAPVDIEPEVEAEQPAPLWSHVENLRAVQTRCPYAEGVEIAVDRDGVVHLLAKSNPAAGGDDAALGQLMVASSWTEAHLGLLPASGVSMKPSRPVLHLFTDRPKQSRRLLETPLRVHLLTAVSVGDRAAWYCTELN